MLRKSIIIAAVVVIGTLSASAQKSVIPIVDMAVGGLIGGVRDGVWVEASKVGPGVAEGTKFNWYFTDGQIIKGIESLSPAAEVPCEDFWSLRFNPDSLGKMADDWTQGVAIGANAGWNPFPRKPMKIADSGAALTYGKTVVAVLKSKGFTKAATAKNVRAWKIDLEGDGVDEVFVQAQTWGKQISPSAKAGDYSIVFLRKVIDGKVENIVIAAEFSKRNAEFSAPSRYLLNSIADLNGDGKMEFTIFSEYYEGGGAQAYSMDGKVPVEIKELQGACGV